MVNFIDTSAIVKMLVTEEGSDQIKYLVEHGPPLYTTDLCFAEALGVMKAKCNRREISEEDYLRKSYYLTALMRDRRLICRGPSITEHDSIFRAEEISKQFNIDLVDAHIIVSIQSQAGEARLISADAGQVEAARSVGLDAWNVRIDPKPADL